MGLDAVVYMNVNNLSWIDDEDKNKLLLEAETGEVYFDVPELISKYLEKDFTAIRKRLGNAANVAALKSEISLAFGNSPSILRDKILYSASHCGDQIGLEMLKDLEAEIDFVRNQSCGSGKSLLEEFLMNMGDLVKAAKEQRQPIVFT
jgi:hypothetical protein